MNPRVPRTWGANFHPPSPNHPQVPDGSLPTLHVREVRVRPFRSVAEGSCLSPSPILPPVHPPPLVPPCSRGRLGGASSTLGAQDRRYESLVRQPVPLAYPRIVHNLPSPLVRRPCAFPSVPLPAHSLPSARRPRSRGRLGGGNTRNQKIS